MTYNPTEWKNGDLITAEKLNNIEEGDGTIAGETYEPTVWQNGDIITAEKLNHIEDGICSADSKIGEQTAEIIRLTNANTELQQELDSLRSSALFVADRYIMVFNKTGSGLSICFASRVGTDDKVAHVAYSRLSNNGQISDYPIYNGNVSFRLAVEGVNHEYTLQNCTVTRTTTELIMGVQCTELVIVFTNPKLNATITFTS